MGAINDYIIETSFDELRKLRGGLIILLKQHGNLIIISKLYTCIRANVHIILVRCGN